MNEKYAGNALLQKTFTVDFLNKKMKKNEGEIPQYYVENNHEAVIDTETFDLVQREIARRSRGKYRSGIHLFSGRIKCGECGGWYGSKVWHSNNKYRKTIWQCNRKFDGDCHCQTPHFSDEEIKQYFIAAANKLLSCKESVIADAREMASLLLDTNELEQEKARLEEEMAEIAMLIRQCIAENASFALDQTEYQKRYAGLEQRCNTTEERLAMTKNEIKKLDSQRADIDDFINAFDKLPAQIMGFYAENWLGLVDFLTVRSKDDVRVTFKNGQEIKV